ncbi:unnamed protein product [Cladocopium goreaui]|uniref:Uncharacterized protein n=1 Tax=Cladocopium goreaui TaxID=2562237 RepID=A0A9P1D531_9DINO|nr:unnamed protein product [Cladocopium goreaui]
MPRPTRSPASPLALSAKAARLLLLLGAPVVFLHCTDYVVENTPASKATRDLHNVDLFSGKGAINSAFVDQKMKSKPFDVETSGTSGDILEVEGFLASIQSILRLREGGLATAGPPCGSFIYLNLGTSLRSKTRPFGGPWAYVKRANRITCRLCLLLLLAFVRCAVHMGSYGHANLKPTVVFGNATWSYRLHIKITKKVRKRIEKNKAKKATVRRYVDQQGNRRVSGNPLQLRASQVYPKGYGKAIASIHASWVENRQNVKNIRDALYPQAGGLVDKMMESVPKAPYQWRHASLSGVADFLRAERDAGRSLKTKARSPPEADSEASTVPATEKELEEAKQKRKEVGVELVTPPSKLMKVKKSESAETFSEPKLSRAIQSKSVLEAKPGDERKVSATAVKAKAAPKQPLTIPKPEQSQQDAKRAQAVHDCLRRPSTGDMAANPDKEDGPCAVHEVLTLTADIPGLRNAASSSRAVDELRWGLDGETRQYLIWDREGEETTVDHVTTTLFQAAEKDEDEKTRGRSRVRSRKGRKHDKKHGKGKKSKGKKKKRSTSSTSSDSSDASSSDKPSSESEEKEAKGKKASKKKTMKKGKGNKRGKSSKSSDSTGQAGKKKRKEETEEQKLKREHKEQEAQQKKELKEQEKEREKEKKAIEKTKNDAFKKDLRKGNQAMTKLSASISKGTSLEDSDKLRHMSGSVVTAILAEVKPHIATMKGARSQLQKSIDAAKVGLGLGYLGYTRGNIYQWKCVCMLHNTYWLHVGFNNLRDGQNWPWYNIKHVFPDPQLRNNSHELC